ncbi:small acid-soluble spore protein, H-type [Gottschalkia purinilytica]|uniref:Small acid-soluble spore protein, H-type n=1 Tax=Gottschalkia purinilytica TaxID=1503 RepID=A0A0L0W8L2_GOTPU|nr:H-type small acid-soluble spore protein [Gottschalkia purinilytica]KNF07787.1 small acid-soluble spore protein, H-type [Gottschalkia purinilytica]
MFLYRADSILNGNQNIKVTYKNKEVWLESLDSRSGEAEVKMLDSNEVIKVPVSELKNHGPQIEGLK